MTSDVRAWLKTPAMRGAIVLLARRRSRRLLGRSFTPFGRTPMPETPPSANGARADQASGSAGAEPTCRLRSRTISSRRTAAPPSAPYRMPGEPSSRGETGRRAAEARRARNGVSRPTDRASRRCNWVRTTDARARRRQDRRVGREGDRAWQGDDNQLIGWTRRSRRAQARILTKCDTIERVLIACVVAGAVAAPPRIARAQRGGAGGQKPPARQPAKPDTSKKAAAAVSLDFQDQDLKVVLDALAAAGELNVSLTEHPGAARRPCTWAVR